MDYIMDWIETQLDDEAIFPQRLGNFSFTFWLTNDHESMTMTMCVLVS